MPQSRSRQLICFSPSSKRVRSAAIASVAPHGLPYSYAFLTEGVRANPVEIPASP